MVCSQRWRRRRAQDTIPIVQGAPAVKQRNAASRTIPGRRGARVRSIAIEGAARPGRRAMPSRSKRLGDQALPSSPRSSSQVLNMPAAPGGEAQRLAFAQRLRLLAPPRHVERGREHAEGLAIRPGDRHRIVHPDDAAVLADMGRFVGVGCLAHRPFEQTGRRGRSSGWVISCIVCLTLVAAPARDLAEAFVDERETALRGRPGRSRRWSG